jgi:thiamine biosynthesis lipoprotein
MPSCPPIVERNKPLLGTYVTVRARGLAAPVANEIMERCFAEVSEIHRRMSFQEFASDVSVLNREAYRRPVRVDTRTFDVLRIADEVSESSDGAFDVTVAPSVVAATGAMAPRLAPAPDPNAHWSDVELLPGRYVRYRRPLWLDLSGIAKGYAVDRVIAILAGAAATQACVNAGGELRVRGPEPEWVRLDVDTRCEVVVPFVALKNESLASSGRRSGTSDPHACPAVCFDSQRNTCSPDRFVSVLAPTCVVADALTKVVMVRGRSARDTLQHFEARALMSDGETGWCEIA